jgi:hypothetical protein
MMLPGRMSTPLIFMDPLSAVENVKEQIAP